MSDPGYTGFGTRRDMQREIQRLSAERDEALRERDARYTQADLDFFGDNADEYFEMTVALRRERDAAVARAERAEDALRAIIEKAGDQASEAMWRPDIVIIARAALVSPPAEETT